MAPEIWASIINVGYNGMGDKWYQYYSASCGLMDPRSAGTGLQGTKIYKMGKGKNSYYKRDYDRILPSQGNIDFSLFIQICDTPL